jgi:hypothetical protein
MAVRVCVQPLRFERAGSDEVNFDTRTLESTIVHSVRALLLLGGINESKLEDPILDFLHRMPLRGAHVDGAVRDALITFLKMNPHRLRDFIRRSSSEAHTKQHMVNMRGDVCCSTDYQVL